jgi:ribosomal protein S18 acetylase RimI-like enzyme
MPDVRPATLDDVDRLARIAAAGFYDDPVLGWVFQDDDRRLDQLTFIMTGLVGDMLPDRGTVHILDGVCAAFWRDPAFEHGRTTADRVEDAVGDARDEPPMPFAPDELERLGILGAAMVAHHPHEPHWYLNVVSTIPEHQGQGLGTAVLQPVLDRCDADGARAYLESSNPRNLSLYRRNGFVDAGEISLPDGPSLIQMWRDPR